MRLRFFSLSSLKNETRVVTSSIMRRRNTAEILPLLEALKSMKPHLRVIVLSHLDDKTRDRLYEAITKVLQSGTKMSDRERRYLTRRLSPYKTQFRVLTAKNKTKRAKKKVLAQVGAGPMSLVLRSGIPLLLRMLPW